MMRRRGVLVFLACAALVGGAGPRWYRARRAPGRSRPASQRNGRWGSAINMPAPKVLTKTGYTDVLSVSCGSPGHSTAGGFYQDNHGHLQGFVTQSSTP